MAHRAAPDGSDVGLAQWSAATDQSVASLTKVMRVFGRCVISATGSRSYETTLNFGVVSDETGALASDRSRSLLAEKFFGSFETPNAKPRGAY